jgi:hypothetical protein
MDVVIEGVTLIFTFSINENCIFKNVCPILTKIEF